MFRRTAPSRSSSAAAHRRRAGRSQISWSAAEAAEMIAAPGVAVSAPAGGGAVTAADRDAEDHAVAVRLDRAWRRLEIARKATEGRPHGIGDDTARRDPVTRPFPIAFGTPARDARSEGTSPAAPARPAVPALPAPAVPAVAAAPRPVRRTQAAVAMHRPPSTGQVARARAPRRLTADRWSAALG